jgi:chloramphenicol-sensitive protein RarD
LSSSLLVLACYVMWGLLAAYWSIFSNIDPLAILSFRIIWSMVFCMLLILAQKEIKKLHNIFHDKRQMLFLFIAGVAVTINWGGYIIAIMSGHVLDASLAYYMYPVFSIVLGYFIYGEKLRPLQWIAFILALVGVTVPIVAYGHIPTFAIIIGLSLSIYGAIKKQVTISGISSTFMETLLMSPLALIYLIANFKFSTITKFQLYMLPTTGIATSLPLIFFAIGIKKTDLSLAGILMYVNPTIQLLIGIFFYGESFSKVQIIMYVFVLIGVFLFLFDSLKNRRSKI